MEDEKRSAFAWIFIIASGIFIGNVLSFGAEEVYGIWKIKQWTTATKSAFQDIGKNKEIPMIPNVPIRINTITPTQKARQAKIDKENEKDRSIRQKLNETCAFWSQQAVTDNKESSFTSRNIACARAQGRIFK